MNIEEQRKMWALMEEANSALKLLRNHPERSNIKDKVFGLTILSIDRFSAQMRKKYYNRPVCSEQTN